MSDKKRSLKPQDLVDLRDSQDNRCAICGREAATELVADHNHETGAFRALLCPSCKTGLGFFGDDPERLQLAVNYLLEHLEQPTGIYYRPTPTSLDQSNGPVMSIRQFLRGGYREISEPTAIVDRRSKGDQIFGAFWPGDTRPPTQQAVRQRKNVIRASTTDPYWLSPPRAARRGTKVRSAKVKRAAKKPSATK